MSDTQTATANSKRCRKHCSRRPLLQKRLQNIDAQYSDIRALLLSATTSPERPVNTFPQTNNLYIQSDQLRVTLDTVMRAQLFELHEAFKSGRY